jgi:hypothetical protein
LRIQGQTLVAQHRVAEISRKRGWQRRSDEIELDESQLRARVDDASPDAETVSASQERLTRVLEYLEANRTARGLEMFERLYVHDQPLERIAAETGLKPDAIYQWRSRLAKLAREADREAAVSEPPSQLGVAQGGRRPR